eukprot:CAMPEP_0179198002 /NCGR_PEP_ID=MMETSP0796-20121207/98473_1 /TAXON_ID=73915 /ORGANISM="Pyrodinium bahamense, Strain pbaha01" /LENGTH=494 /DNA_ID=CAMNT_0020902435 /DNA_START=23 /DNA_END=1505 /DNA_ORIENTATION=+
MAPRTSKKKGQLISSASSVTALGHWIQQSTESITRATHPFMTQVRAKLPVGAEGEAPRAELRPRRPRASQSEIALAAALRSRGGAATKKASTPPAGASPRQQQPAGACGSSDAGGAGAGAACEAVERADEELACVSAAAAAPDEGLHASVPHLHLRRGCAAVVGCNQQAPEHEPLAALAEGIGAAAGSSPVAAKQPAGGLVAQLDEFFRRGTPRAPLPAQPPQQQQLQPGYPVSGCGHGPVAARPAPGAWAHGRCERPLRGPELRLAAWARARGLPPGAAVPRLLDVEPVAPAPALRPEIGDRAMVIAREVSILWRGISVDVLLEGPAGAGAPVAEAGDIAAVAGAHTDCDWAKARVAVAAAAECAAGLPLEAFLDALAEAWPQGGANQNKAEFGSVEGGLGSQPSSTGRARSASPLRASLASLGSSSTRSGSDVAVLASEGEASGDSFADWLSERPPLWRFDHASRGLAWDSPPSKAEKRELLLLQLFAEEGE